MGQFKSQYDLSQPETDQPLPRHVEEAIFPLALQIEALVAIVGVEAINAGLSGVQLVVKPLTILPTTAEVVAPF